jgi:hypothetical protein
MPGWSDTQKWWMDLAKSGITFVVGLVITLTIVHAIQSRRDARQKRVDAVFALRLATVDAFQRASVLYELASLAAYTDLYQWIGKSKTEAMSRYETTAYGELSAATSSFRIRFRDRQPILRMVEELEQLNVGRHKLYDDLVDRRLDNRPDTAIEPKATRPRFDELLTSIRAKREEILRATEEVLASS